MQCAAGERPEQAAGTAHAPRPGRLPSPPKARLSLSPSFSRTRLRVHKQGDRDVGQEKGDGDQAHGPAGQGEGGHWRDVARSRLTKKRGDAGKSKRRVCQCGRASARPGGHTLRFFRAPCVCLPTPTAHTPLTTPLPGPPARALGHTQADSFHRAPPSGRSHPRPSFRLADRASPPSRNRAPPSLSRRFHAPACSPWPSAPPPGPPAGQA